MTQTNGLFVFIPRDLYPEVCLYPEIPGARLLGLNVGLNWFTLNFL